MLKVRFMFGKTKTLKSSHGDIVVSHRHCASLISRLAQESPPDGSQVLFRRETFRWPIQAPAAIRYEATSGKRVTVDGIVTDMSATGMGVLCAQELPPKTPAEIFITAEGKTYSATVQILYCTLRPDGFRIGCEFVVREES